MLRTVARLTVPLAFAALLTPRPADAQRALPADSLEIARRVAQFYYAGEVDSVASQLSFATLRALGGRSGLGEAIGTVRKVAGTEETVIEERWNLRNGARQYWRTSRIAGYPYEVLLRINLDERGRVIGLAVAPAHEAPRVDRRGPVIAAR